MDQNAVNLRTALISVGKGNYSAAKEIIQKTTETQRNTENSSVKLHALCVSEVSEQQRQGGDP